MYMYIYMYVVYYLRMASHSIQRRSTVVRHIWEPWQCGKSQWPRASPLAASERSPVAGSGPKIVGQVQPVNQHDH